MTLELEFLGILKAALLPVAGIASLAVAFWLILRRQPPAGTVVARLGGLTWHQSQFCRGWLITGSSGSGKTTSGINQIAPGVPERPELGWPLRG